MASRKMEYSDMKFGAEFEAKPKSNHWLFLPGKIFRIVNKVTQHCGVGYATHYTMQCVETGKLSYSRLPLSSLRNYLHKRKEATNG